MLSPPGRLASHYCVVRRSSSCASNGIGRRREGRGGRGGWAAAGSNVAQMCSNLSNGCRHFGQVQHVYATQRLQPETMCI